MGNSQGLPDPSTQLRPVSSDDFLPPTHRWVSLSGMVLAGAVLSAVALASVTNYNVTVKADAVVRPVGELRLVQPQIDGTVKQILVKENQVVRQGDAIAYMDDSQLQTKKHQLEDSLQQDRLQLLQLSAQIRAVDSQIAAESSVISETVVSAEAELSRSQRDHRDRTITAEADVQEAEAALDLARDQRDRYAQLVNAGAVSQMQLNEKEAAVKSAAARLERAQTALQPSVAPVAIAQQQIAQQQAKGKSTLAALQKDREALTQQQAQLQAQRSKNEKDLLQTNREVQRTTIWATSDDIVLQLKLRNVGQVVRPGEAIAQIAPQGTAVVLRARVATQDIEKVVVGQRVQLRVDACPYPDYGTLAGIVKAVSPDAIAPIRSGGEESNLGGAASYFEVTIQPNASVLGQGERHCKIQPGMEAKADVISKSETVLQFLLRKARLLADV